MSSDDKAFLLQELIRVYRCMRAGIAVTEAEHAWIEQQCAELQTDLIARARALGGNELPEIQFPDDTIPGGGGG